MLCYLALSINYDQEYTNLWSSELNIPQVKMTLELD